MHPHQSMRRIMVRIRFAQRAISSRVMYPFSNASCTRSSYPFAILISFPAFCLAVMLAVGPPVGRYHSLKVPLTAQNTGQKILVLRCLNAVDQVVGRHDCVWICLFYDDLEGFQVNLTQRTLGNAGIAVFFGLFLCCCSRSVSHLPRYARTAYRVPLPHRIFRPQADPRNNTRSFFRRAGFCEC